jgi:hypothetical protein
VSGRLGRDPFGSPGRLTIEAVASRDGEAWVAKIYARERGGAAIGSRTLRSEAASCASLVDAAALAIALVIDPEAVERTERARAARAETAGGAEPSASAPTPAPAATPRVSPQPQVAQPATPAPTEPAQRASGWVDVRAAGDFGLLPEGLAPGLGMIVDLPIAGALGARAGLTYWPERETAAADGRFAFGLSAAALGACAPFLPRGALGVALCAAGTRGAVFRQQAVAPGVQLGLGVAF